MKEGVVVAIGVMDFHYSWHAIIDGILFKMLDIMELYSFLHSQSIVVVVRVVRQCSAHLALQQ
jgi:hypothetical protein